ncbi:hypothetical protein N7456_001812 [Penicillium angulare]|uniref:Uncharacterized protein n=1 Tax=Penicillium angulare TaxID=116970 RepID=A0A9W9KPQ2_9EURO|nr:hypothetical protein N7456_001812 [Penicillium angulare]
MVKSNTKEPIPDCGSPDQVPVYKKLDKVLVLVLLTDLTESEKIELVRGKLGQYIEDGIKIKTWTPSTKLLRSISQRGPNRDSRANIHALAMLAFQSGLEFVTAGTSFLVANELTKRILRNTCRPGESNTELVVMIVVRTNPRKTNPLPAHLEWLSWKGQDGIRVVATRFRIQLWDLYGLGDINPFELTERRDGQETLSECLAMYQMGNYVDHFPEFEGRGFDEIDFSTIHDSSMVLCDPDAPPFTIQKGISTTHLETLKAVVPILSSRLPPELIDSTIAHLTHQPRIQGPLWRKPQTDKHIHFFLMYPETEKHIKNMALKIRDSYRATHRGHPGITVELISFERHQMRSRRDMISFYNEYRVFNPSQELGFPTLHLIPEDDSPGYPYDTPLRQRLKFCLVSEAEAAFDPEQPFYSNPPPWAPITAYNNGEYDPFTECIPVFYLTKELTPEQDLAVKAAISKKDPGYGNESGQLEDSDFDDEDEYEWGGIDERKRKDARFVPWEKDDDATLDDIFKILVEVYNYQGMGYQCLNIFCIDRDSPTDRCLLLVQADLYLSGKSPQKKAKQLRNMIAPTLRGFRYIRISAEEAHAATADLDSCQRMIEEVGRGDDEGKHFIRSDWPNQRSLVPEPPFRPGFPYPGRGHASQWELFNI